MTKSTTRLVQPAKINTPLHAVWPSLKIACAFYSLQAIQRGMNENPCHTGLIWAFAGHTGLIVGFVVHWLITIICHLPI